MVTGEAVRAGDLLLRDHWTYMGGRRPDRALQQKVVGQDSQKVDY